MKYKEQVNTKTGEKRWVPIEGSENLVDKINSIPIVGGVTKPITKVISGAMIGAELNKNLPIISDSSANQQKISLELAKLAQLEKDPVKKQRLLDRSRAISQGATSQLEGYVNPVMENMPTDYQNKETPTTPGQIVGAYGADALKAGMAVGEAYSLPSQVNETLKLAKGGINLVKGGVSAVKNKVSDVSTAEKVRKFVTKVNPQVSAKDVNYLEKKNAILEFAKKFAKTGKESADQILTSASNKRNFNLKAIGTILKNKETPVDSLTLGKKILSGLGEVELDPNNPAVKTAVKNVDRILTGVIDDTGNISPADLYKLYGDIGNKAYGAGVKEVKPIYQKVYSLLGEELKTISPRVRKMITENAKIRDLLPGIIKTTEKNIKKGLLGGFGRKAATAGAGVATGIAINSLFNVFKKK